MYDPTTVVGMLGLSVLPTNKNQNPQQSFQLFLPKYITENQVVFLLYFPDTGPIRALDTRELINACSRSPQFHENCAAMVFMPLNGHSTKWILDPFVGRADTTSIPITFVITVIPTKVVGTV